MNTMQWIPGQCVLSQSEPELGVGIILENTDSRQILEVHFEASSVRRRYALKNPPLRRLHLSLGQEARGRLGQKFRVHEILDKNGLYLYRGEAGQQLWEYELDARIEDLGALEQFLMGQWSPPSAFDLREKAWKLRALALQSRLRGLVGPRVNLLAHQLYIAFELSRRTKARALLADEVGLGKTIEAGLVLASLRSLERANRVLILVPDSLKHQWLAEMYRRFHILFSVADEESAPFSSQQLWIASLDFLRAHPEAMEQVLAESWDLLIVDEAHHLKWSPTQQSESWRMVQKISALADGLLLLTATPRQQGLESQFGLLHLVDPERFADFAEFSREAQSLAEVSRLAKQLETGENLVEARDRLRNLFAQDRELLALLDDLNSSEGIAKALSALVDRHGTGRVLFRNRRERLKGFPPRKLFYSALAANEKERSQWLLNFLAKLGQDKALILCSSQKKLRELEKFLDKESGIKRAVFHEELDLIERDRQAAWFAQPNGAQILISSEVGGEGRNFQFCHKLVLYDLPLHPDLVEQRIGRLDRIGQTHTIEIYVPWLKATGEEVLFRWYHEGLNCFERSWNGLAALEEKFHEPLHALIARFAKSSEAEPVLDLALHELIAQTQIEVKKLQSEIQASTDYLLDLNSFKPEVGKALAAELEEIERGDFLRSYMQSSWDYFGVEQEDFDEYGSVKLTPGSLMFVQNFPGLEDEKVMTFSRHKALAREDFGFLTQDHPMVQGSLSLLLDHNQGRASGCLASGARQGVYFEFLFLLSVMAKPSLEVERFFAPELVRVTLDLAGHWQGLSLFDATALRPLPEPLVRASLSQLRDSLPKLYARAHAQVQSEVPAKVERACIQASDILSAEENRLRALRQYNGTVSVAEIATMVERRDETLAAIKMAELRLDAVRMVLVQ